MHRADSWAASLTVLLLWALSSDAGAQTPDITPPPALPGEVADGTADFNYASDAEAADPQNNRPYPMVNHWICNREKNKLIFVWEKAKLARGPEVPLEQGRCQDDPHSVVAIDQKPDTNAPILYTQAGRSRSASIYNEAASTAAVAGDTTSDQKTNGASATPNEAYSAFRTTFADVDGKEQTLFVGISHQVIDKALVLRVDAKPPDVRVALGGTEWLWKENLVDFTQLAADAKGFDVEVTNLDAVVLLREQDYNWLPSSLRSGPVLLMQGAGFATGKFALSIPVDPSLRFQKRSQILLVLDSKGRLIGTGSYSQLLPEQ